MDSTLTKKTEGLKQEGVYVIAGGSGTVGRIITGYLIREYNAKVIWIGRKPERSEEVQEKLVAMNALGQAPLYIQADVTDLKQLKQAVNKIKKQYSGINGAIFSGLVFTFENSIYKTTEQEFLDILSVKTRGSLNFYSAFQHETLDFMCFFSSGQAFSFSGAANLSAYASGITFSDTFVRYIQGKAKFPVGAINWGFWDSSVKDTPLGDKISSLEDREGFDCFNSIAGLLQCGLSQVVCIKVSRSLNELMNCKEEIATVYDRSSRPILRSLLNNLGTREYPGGNLLSSYIPEGMAQWVPKMLFIQMRNLLFRQKGVPMEIAGIRKAAGIIDKYGLWLKECLNILEAYGYVQSDAVRITANDSPELQDVENVWREWDSVKESFCSNPDWKASIRLLDVCLRKLPDILTGQISSTDVLFPDSSMELLEGIYKNNTTADYFNILLADVVEAYICKRICEDMQAKIRIIEVGAGTGGTSAVVFDRIKSYASNLEYCYTDISKSFLLYAKEKYGPDNPYLTYKSWNVELPLAQQDIEAGAYDIVIAANVLHATKDIRQVIRNTKAALKCNGILLLNEMSRKSVFTTLTFGLLDGWWRFEDQALRIIGAPLLEPKVWKEVLEDEGFRHISFPAEAVLELGQQIIAAESDGVVRQKAVGSFILKDNLFADHEKDNAGQSATYKALPALPVQETLRNVTNPAFDPSDEGMQKYIMTVVLKLLSKVLKVPQDEIDSDIAFSDYGVDSVLGISFVNQINSEFDIKLNSAILFDYTTANLLAGFIIKTYGEKIRDMATTALSGAASWGGAGIHAVMAGNNDTKVLQEVKRELSAEQQEMKLTGDIVPTKEDVKRFKPAAIAVVGIAGQFPDAEDVNIFWNNMENGHDGVHELSRTYLDQSRYYDCRKQAGKTYCKWGGILEGRDCFDPLFFNISPREAESMNPHQRLIMQESWKALEDAGYNPKSLAGSQVGVFIGAEPANYFYESFTGSSDAIVASRLSYYLNLNGPALVVNTGCSSSAAAIHLACESLRNEESSLALAGGVYAKLDHTTLVTLSDIEMISPTGRCLTFDERADGTIMSEGVGMVVLKRLCDAVADGDHIYGVIAGSGMNQDGASNGITAPNGLAQERLITDTYKKYGINPEEITYVEAHGTGTKLGDPVEANALIRAFRQFTDKKCYCAIGSAKSYIGHTGAAAGVISLIKVLLSLRHRKIPGLLNFKKQNPLIDFNDAAFYINTGLIEWKNDNNRPLTAALNAFGHSGTNVHLVIQEYHQNDQAFLTKDNGPVLIPLSARNEDRLKEYAAKLKDFLENLISNQYAGEARKNHTILSLGSLAYTLQRGREAMEERIIFLVHNVSELISGLESFIEGKTGVDNFWSGQIRKDKNQLHVFDTEEDTKEIIDKWVSNGNLRKLGELWAKGFDINWEALYDGIKPKRMSLPTYPFAREYYRAPLVESESGDSQDIGTCGHLPLLQASIHPFLHQNTSDLLEQRFSSIFTGEEFFLAGHVVNRQKVLPGVAYLEMARAAADQAAGRFDAARTGIRLKNVVWAKPVVVETEPVNVHIGLYPEENGEIAYEIYSEAGEEKVVHSQGSALLTGITGKSRLDIQELQHRCSKDKLSSDRCYEAFKAIGLDYGHGYRGIEKVLIGQGEVLAKLTLPSSVLNTQGQYVMHPAMLDSALQASIGLLGVPDEHKLSLPFALDELEVLDGCTSEMWAYVKYSEGCKAGDKVEKLDIVLCDGQGNVSVRMRGFSLRVLGADLQDAKTALPVSNGEIPEGRVMLAPVWDAVPVEKGQTLPLPSARIVLMGGTNENRSLVRQHYPEAHIFEIQEEEGIEAIAQKLKEYGVIDHIFWIAPYYPIESLAMNMVIEEQNRGVIQVFRIIKALLELGYDSRELGFDIITLQAQPIHIGDIVNPSHASVHGFAGSLAKEYPDWRIRVIDLEAGYKWPLEEIFTLVPEPYGSPLVYRNGEWYRQQVIPVDYNTTGKTTYKTGGVYVVIGGAGGIGEAWSEYMIKTYRARIIWIGRREKNTEIQEKLDKLAALGTAPHYIAADAADLKALLKAYKDIKKRYAQINGVIHSAIVLQDQSLARMDEERFKTSLSAKVDVSVRIAQVFGKEPLDFVLFFSAIQSFIKAPGQSNYAAGCTFKDAFAHQLDREWPCQVKVMNWGYWGSTGVVASPEYRERMTKAGIGSIDTEEAMEALERLLSGDMNQVAFIKTTRSTTVEGINYGELITVCPESTMPDVHTVLGHIPKLPRPEKTFGIEAVNNMKGELPTPAQEMDEMLGKLLWGQLQAVGIFKEEKFALVDPKTRVISLYARWLEESLDILTRRDYLASCDGFVMVVDKTRVDIDALWREWDEKKVRWLEAEGLKASVVLAEATLRVLPEILTGKIPATDIIFPDSSLKLVEGIYRQNPVADYFNEVLASLVEAYVKERIKQEPAARIRLLEIGAGTGGTTAVVLQRLRPYKEYIGEYCYTDISKAFLLHAEKEYGGENPYLTYKILNIEEAIDKQEVNEGVYDLMIATNVLHATRNIRQTLRNAKAALKKNGLILLNEISGNILFTHLTFGLLEGWWVYEDPMLRIPGCPGLYPDTWQRVLEREGFRPVLFPAIEEHNLGHQIIASQSDGVIRKKQLLRQAPVKQAIIAEIMEKEAEKLKKGGTQADETGLATLREKSTLYLKKLVGETLKIPSHKIDSSEPLEKYGIDSILVVRLTNNLRKVMDNISSTLFFEYQTIDALVEHFIDTRKASLISLVGMENEEPGGLLADEKISGPLLSERIKLPMKRHRRFMPVADQGVATPSVTVKDIAIIGLSGRYPGARNVDEFWNNLKAGKNCISEIPEDRWDWRKYYDEEKGKRGCIYTKWGGFIEDIDKFDPLFFSISPREAERMDPQERLFLETAYACIEDAGYVPATLGNSRRIGVFVGVMNGNYPVGANYSSIANRVSYVFNFQGPSIAVDTACSSSLTAIHLALESLYSGISECAIAGGVNLISDAKHYVNLSSMTMLSPGNLCRSFGDKADGFIDAEGVGAIILKPLQKAIEDGDHIYGVIKGSMINAGGKTNGYTVPNPNAQFQLVS
ncbi:MAG: SDR family NAD(P)-dependent oxidoreductase, partial [Clostridia bacterium]|nr:SDR family NAD(P)-dependent oxidoreductase [Clostridia bacterium]